MRIAVWRIAGGAVGEDTPGWPLQVIAIANIVLCMACKGGVGVGGIYCAMVVQ